MKRVRNTATGLTACVALVLIGATPRAQDASSTEARVAALKQSLQENQARLRQYEWIETTTLSLKGEEKSHKQQRCYYGADGKVQKVPLGSEPAPAPAPQKGGGRRGGRLKERIVENKKEDMKDYMEQAAALIHQYVPPDPGRIQQAKDAGHVAVTPQGTGGIRMEISSYLQPSDLLAIDIDAAGGRLGAVSLKTYLEKPEDAIALNARFNTLPDGTNYVAQTTLDVTAKHIRVVIESSGHRSK